MIHLIPSGVLQHVKSSQEFVFYNFIIKSRIEGSIFYLKWLKIGKLHTLYVIQRGSKTRHFSKIFDVFKVHDFYQDVKTLTVFIAGTVFAETIEDFLYLADSFRH